MTPEQRNDALNRLKTVIPTVVFERFIMVLTQVSESSNNKLVEALDRMCTDDSDGFWYNMNTGETQDVITPIREIIDLLEGWILTATVDTTHNRVKWHVQSIMTRSE